MIYRDYEDDETELFIPMSDARKYPKGHLVSVLLYFALKSKLPDYPPAEKRIADVIRQARNSWEKKKKQK